MPDEFITWPGVEARVTEGWSSRCGAAGSESDCSGSGCSGGMGSIPGLGASICRGRSHKKEKRKKKKRVTEDSRRLRTRSDVVASVALMLTLYFFL